jgi:hypothetical protein
LVISGFATQPTEVAIGVKVLNWMLAVGPPDFVRRLRVVA